LVRFASRHDVARTNDRDDIGPGCSRGAEASPWAASSFPNPGSSLKSVAGTGAAIPSAWFLLVLAAAAILEEHRQAVAAASTATTAIVVTMASSPMA
jgi:hypothetical protein